VHEKAVRWGQEPNGLSSTPTGATAEMLAACGNQVVSASSLG